MPALLAGVKGHLIGPSPCVKLRLASVHALYNIFRLGVARKDTISIQVICKDDLREQVFVNGSAGIFEEKVPRVGPNTVPW